MKGFEITTNSSGEAKEQAERGQAASVLLEHMSCLVESTVKARSSSSSSSSLSSLSSSSSSSSDAFESDRFIDKLKGLVLNKAIKRKMKKKEKALRKLDSRKIKWSWSSDGDDDTKSGEEWEKQENVEERVFGQETTTGTASLLFQRKKLSEMLSPQMNPRMENRTQATLKKNLETMLGRGRGETNIEYRERVVTNNPRHQAEQHQPQAEQHRHHQAERDNIFEDRPRVVTINQQNNHQHQAEQHRHQSEQHTIEDDREKVVKNNHLPEAELHRPQAGD
ncbi:corepressor interacting with RBPJ 1-like [Procambarus clarkii]|uniref:corepressor interacting with RBPJ 1-like n=1 Tax=Procambarus clarkii TaxID=6728 RepID=UPI003741F19A